MNLTCRPATIRRCCLLLSIAGLSLLPMTTAAADPVRLVSARTIEIPDVRILSMSPEGSSIVGVRPMIGYRDDGELCVFDTATLAERSCADLSVLDAGLRLEDVTWSPDGSMLAFGEEAFKLFFDGDLWLMDAATGSLTNLDDDGFEGSLPLLGREPNTEPITIAVSPTFTSDGSGVTWSRSTIVDGDFVGNDIATVPVSGGKAESLLSVSTERPGIVYFGMRWTQDGSTLFYNVNDVDTDSPLNGIWSVGADGLGARLVARATDPELDEPAVAQVAPGANRLLAWYPRSAGRMQVLEPLALVDPSTGAPSPLTVEDAREPRIAMVQMAAFSPDGTTLLEVTRRTDPDHQVLVRDLATGQVTALVPDGLEFAGPPLYLTMPTWATNGTVLITGGAALDRATLLTLEGGLPQ